MLNTKSGRTFWLSLFLGVALGVVANELIRAFAPQSPVKEILVRYVSFGFGPLTVDLNFLKFTFGFHFGISLTVVLAVLFVLYLVYKIL